MTRTRWLWLLVSSDGRAYVTTTYNNPRGRLRSLGLIDYSSPGQVVARPVLFLEASA